MSTQSQPQHTVCGSLMKSNSSASTSRKTPRKGLLALLSVHCRINASGDRQGEGNGQPRSKSRESSFPLLRPNLKKKKKKDRAMRKGRRSLGILDFPGLGRWNGEWRQSLRLRERTLGHLLDTARLQALLWGVGGGVSRSAIASLSDPPALSHYSPLHCFSYNCIKM